MTINPKTIQDLGKDASTAYARLVQLQEEFKASVVQDPSVIQKIPHLPVLHPQPKTDFEAKYINVGHALMAKFTEPAQTAQSSIFSFELIPSLGPCEKFEEPQALIDEVVQKYLQSNPDISEKQLQEIQKQEPIVVQFLHTYHFLAKTLSDIQAQRNRFQRG